jgi:hypothetical protein
MKLLALLLLTTLLQAGEVPSPPAHLDACRVQVLTLQSNLGQLQAQIAQLNYELIVRDACEGAGIKRLECEVDANGAVSKAKVTPPAPIAPVPGTPSVSAPKP